MKKHEYTDTELLDIQRQEDLAALAKRPLKFRPRYDKKDDQVITFDHDPGSTLQEPAEDADINILMARMGVKDGSQLPYFQNPRAIYGDFSEIPQDPTEAAELIRTAQENFMTIPAKVRQQFRTPDELFQFMNNDDNYDRAIELGLLAPRAPVSSSTSSDKETLVPPSTETK